jgi:hypothetical protein
MSDEDRRYFSLRAQAELDRAKCAADPTAASVHYRLAQAYLQRLMWESPVTALQPDRSGQ